LRCALARAAKLERIKMDGPTQKEVDALYWWHSFVFPNGVVARGGKSLELLQAEAEVAFKNPVQGKSVLDVGAWNGYFSVEAVRRGARKVTALDRHTWESPQIQGFKGFELARRHLAPSIEAVNRDVMDLRSNPVGQFDCVLFLGVLYHLKHPLYVLETLFAMTLEYVVVETYVESIECSRPAMVFYPGKELAGDMSNWWGPNTQCVIDMLRVVGFSRVEHVSHPIHKNRAIFYAFK
jgi:tRNA (mo5U34)-methyltransferase